MFDKKRLGFNNKLVYRTFFLNDWMNVGWVGGDWKSTSILAIFKSVNEQDVLIPNLVPKFI